MGKPKSTGPAITPTVSGEVTRENYVALFTQAIRARGGGGFVIRNHEPKDRGNPTPAEWHAWVVYFDAHGIPTQFLSRHGVGTVPSQWPEEFDENWSGSDRGWRFPFRATESPEMRRRVAELFGKLSRSLPKTVQQAPPAAKDDLRYRDSPLTLSPALRASLGLGEA